MSVYCFAETLVLVIYQMCKFLKSKIGSYNLLKDSTTSYQWNILNSQIDGTPDYFDHWAA